MKKIDLGQTITILANLGVIAGIVFLAVELQQNNQLMRAEAISTLLETRMVAIGDVIDNDSFAELLLKNRRGEILTDVELLKLNANYARGLIDLQRNYFLFQEGILPEEYLKTNLPRARRSWSRKGEIYSRVEHWETDWRQDASPAFRLFVERCVLAECDEIPR